MIKKIIDALFLSRKGKYITTWSVFGLTIAKDNGRVLSSEPSWAIVDDVWTYGPFPKLSLCLKEMIFKWRSDSCNLMLCVEEYLNNKQAES